MLELAGLGIAMGNGNEKLKNVADFATKKSSETRAITECHVHLLFGLLQLPAILSLAP
jgi:hydroxymethylpyrimidine pyrophosphatase-like HAD family hydrolase